MVEKNHLPIEDEVLTCRTVAGQPAQAEWLAGLPGRWSGEQTDRWTWRPDVGRY